MLQSPQRPNGIERLVSETDEKFLWESVISALFGHEDMLIPSLG